MDVAVPSANLQNDTAANVPNTRIISEASGHSQAETNMNNCEEDPLVSVIIPNYNSPNLAKTLFSVFNQSYKNIQIILVDDYSAQWDEKWITGFFKENCKLRSWLISRNECNLGTVKTVNRAIQYAEGKYVFSLACDDCFHDENVILDWVREFQRSGAGVITAKRQQFDSEMKSGGRIQPEPWQIRWLQNLSPTQLFEKMSGENFIFGCCTARSAANIQEYGLCDEKYRLIDDYPLYLRLLRQNVVIHFFDRIVIDYRGGGTSSAESYNPVYEIESNRIFRDEILACSKYKISSAWKYCVWRKHQRLSNKLYKSCINVNKRTMKYTALRLFFIALQPSYLLLLFYKKLLAICTKRSRNI